MLKWRDQSVFHFPVKLRKISDPSHTDGHWETLRGVVPLPSSDYLSIPPSHPPPFLPHTSVGANWTTNCWCLWLALRLTWTSCERVGRWTKPATPSWNATSRWEFPKSNSIPRSRSEGQRKRVSVIFFLPLLWGWSTACQRFVVFYWGWSPRSHLKNQNMGVTTNTRGACSLLSEHYSWLIGHPGTEGTRPSRIPSK